MSEQVGGILEIPSSYNFARDKTSTYRNKSIDPATFHAWHAQNMYQSSYGQFHSKQSNQPKNTAIPGYGGYIPYVVPENIHAKGFSPIAKESFNKDKLAKNILGLTTSGFNLNKQVFVDKSKFGTTSKYGKSALQKPHPTWNEAQWVPTTRDFFQNPNNLLNPTYRSTEKHLQTEKPFTKGSGYATNHSYLDGKGWNPHPILKGDNNRTEYRDRFNAKTDFHRNTFVAKERRLQKTEMNYKYN